MNGNQTSGFEFNTQGGQNKDAQDKDGGLPSLDLESIYLSGVTPSEDFRSADIGSTNHMSNPQANHIKSIAKINHDNSPSPIKPAAQNVNPFH